MKEIKVFESEEQQEKPKEKQSECPPVKKEEKQLQDFREDSGKNQELEDLRKASERNQQKRKQNNSLLEDEKLLKLESALENTIQQLADFEEKQSSQPGVSDGIMTDGVPDQEYSEFADEEEGWSFFGRKKKEKNAEGNTTGPGSHERENEGSGSSEVEYENDEDPDTDYEYSDIEDEELESEEFSGDAEGADDEDEDDLGDVYYLQSAAYRRRAKRTLTYEQREARRKARIAAFWDFADRKRKQIRWGVIGVLVLIAATVTSFVVKNWTYHSVKELVYSDKEDTLSVSYENINGKILKYGVDSAMLVDHGNTMLWTVSYDMNAPSVVLCGETFAVYDSKGTSIIICNELGQIGAVATDMPVVKVKISKQGTVAAILEDGQKTWIKCYKKDGSEIATLKTTFTNPGYPMDIALSADGSLMAVNYLYLDNGTPVSRVAFYNFGTVGQNQKDNLVAQTEYRDRILPEAEYLDGKNCVVFREDGFSVFTGSQIPMESVKVEVEQSIVSTFYDSEYIGLVLRNRNSEMDYLICVYNKRGREILRKETDFHYQSIDFNGNQILLSSRDEFCVYNLQGVEQYRDSLEIPARVFKGFGRNKFIYVSEDVFRIVQIS
ncbi:MAG: DUF5711 family protein [Lachnospiraceae bacterium]|nr:DUF5711 family protein [Lachnospiraceae bacterium]